LRADFEKALSLIPGKHRLNLHACYADLRGRKVDRNAYTVEHFQSWIDWAKARGLGMDFNPTCFAHPLADGASRSRTRTPASASSGSSNCIASRRIGPPSVSNWVRPA